MPATNHQPPTHNQLGFTLIELLIAISIIGVVFGVVISSNAKIQQNGRNARREADLRIIQSALQQYFADHNYFPDSITPGSALNQCTGGDNTNAPNCTSLGTKNYLQTVPQDPNTTPSYCYVALDNSASAATATECDNDNLANRCFYYKLYTKQEGVTATYARCGSGSPNYSLELTPN